MKVLHRFLVLTATLVYLGLWILPHPTSALPKCQLGGQGLEFRETGVWLGGKRIWGEHEYYMPSLAVCHRVVLPDQEIVVVDWGTGGNGGFSDVLLLIRHDKQTTIQKIIECPHGLTTLAPARVKNSLRLSCVGPDNPLNVLVENGRTVAIGEVTSRVDKPTFKGPLRRGKYYYVSWRARYLGNNADASLEDWDLLAKAGLPLHWARIEGDDSPLRISAAKENSDGRVFIGPLEGDGVVQATRICQVLSSRLAGTVDEMLVLEDGSVFSRKSHDCPE